jgi:hypothetical protein
VPSSLKPILHTSLRLSTRRDGRNGFMWQFYLRVTCIFQRRHFRVFRDCFLVVTLFKSSRAFVESVYQLHLSLHCEALRASDGYLNVCPSFSRNYEFGGTCPYFWSSIRSRPRLSLMLKPVSTSFMCSCPVILLLNLSAAHHGETLFGTYRYRQISSFLASRKT